MNKYLLNVSKLNIHRLSSQIQPIYFMDYIKYKLYSVIYASY